MSTSQSRPCRTGSGWKERVYRISVGRLLSTLADSHYSLRPPESLPESRVWREFGSDGDARWALGLIFELGRLAREREGEVVQVVADDFAVLVDGIDARALVRFGRLVCEFAEEERAFSDKVLCVQACLSAPNT